MPGQLFTHYFLTDGIKATAEWKASVARPEVFAAFRDGVLQKYETLSHSAAPNEAVTEQDLIRPVLGLLGWTDYLPQQGAARNEDIPDHLLFVDAAAKQRAAAKRKPEGRYQDALVVQESKRFALVLDAQDDKIRSGTPHGQILRYLSTADTASDGRIRWGILTNGRVWRLYDHHARPRASGYFEVDLAEQIEPGKEDGLRVFHLLFQRDSFTLQEGATTTFLEAALAEGRRYEERVAQDLAGVVFERVFLNLVQAVADATDKSLAEVREAALIFLYRLLFVLYAEDRGLLPVNDSRYDDYGLRRRVRDDIARRMDDKDTFSAHAASYYDHLMTLFRLIDKGDPSIGLPPYNGGLFASETASLLEEARLPDNAIAHIIYDLSHTTSGERRFVNYRDMSVQQLGSIYERLLEHKPVRDEDGKIIIRPNPYARKDSGSFFTPQELVDLIVERTLKPLAEERLKAFEDKTAELKSQRRPKSERKDEVEWFATRDPELALAPTAAARGKGIQRLRKQGSPLATEFDHAKERADRLGEVVRASGDYPLLSGGDINLYSLFVERAMNLIKPDGFVGLLTPSGIYADKTAARFFKSVSTSGRVGGLFDFENRRLGTDLPPFFPDVDSRFKFCALIFGDQERRFDETKCAFFLHDTKEIHGMRAHAANSSSIRRRPRHWKRSLSSCQSQQLQFRLRCSSESSSNPSHMVRRRTISRHRTSRLRPLVRIDTRPRSHPRPRASSHVHHLRYEALRPRSRLRRPAFYLGRRRTSPPARPPRRALFPPLWPDQRRRGVRAGDLPHRPQGRRSHLRPLPHPRPHPRLHKRPLRRRHGNTCGDLGRHRPQLERGNLNFIAHYVKVPSIRR